MNLPKCVLLTLHINLMYVFRADYYVLEKTVAPGLGIPHLPLFLCAGMRPPGLSLAQFHTSVSVVLLQLMLRHHVGENLWVCGITWKHNFTANA